MFDHHPHKVRWELERSMLAPGFGLLVMLLLLGVVVLVPGCTG